MVHSRPRYIVGWMPRVKGNSPGKERSRSGSNAARSPGPAKGFMRGIVRRGGTLVPPSLIRFFDLGLFRRDAQRTEEAAIVDGHFERLPRNQRLGCRHVLGTIGVGRRLSAVDESDNGFEIHFHLVPGRTRAFATSFDFGTLCHGGGNGVGQLPREPVYDVIHRTAPSRWATASCPICCAKRLGPSATANAHADRAAGGAEAQVDMRRAFLLGKPGSF